jgi:beta-glucosidase
MSLVDSLLEKMTIDEKIGQLNLVTAGQATTGPAAAGDIVANIRAGNVGAVLNLWGGDSIAAMQKIAIEETRLGVPLFFALDVLHGHRTIFPIPLAETGTFDPELWEQSARASAAEAAADGVDLTFAPMLDIARDPRWGRIAEGPGEDPLVAARFAAAKVKGFQGANLADPAAIAATAKHFCAGGAAQGGREYAAVDVSDRILREIYLPPFEAAVAAGCAAVMPAFNSVAGVPMSAHVALLRGYLRRGLGFDGLIISDYTAIAELVEHGVAVDRVEAAALALRAGVDMDMVSGCYLLLKEALARGLALATDIDAAVRRVLTLKQKLGLFDDPYRRLKAPRPAAPREAALDVARRSIALLENKGVLPLAASMPRLAVVGPLADARAEMAGPWAVAGSAESAVTILEGLKAALPQTDIVYHQGVGLIGDDASGIGAARALCAGADAIVLCIGESAQMSGEAASRATLAPPGRQNELAEAVLGLGIPVVLVLSSGRPLAISAIAERAAAVVASWFLGDMAGVAIADVLTGRFNPSGRLAATWPREVGQIPSFYAARSTGRPPDENNPFTSKYIDAPVEPLYYFGHGLSYGAVTLSDLRATTGAFEIGSDVEVSAEASNSGSVAREDTIFLFLRDKVARVARPLLELKDWRKIALASGETKRVVFRLAAQDFAYLDENLQGVVEAGAFEIGVGFSADARRLKRLEIQLISATNTKNA